MRPTGSSGPEADLALGRLAVELRLVSQDQLRDVLAIAARSPGRMALGARLIMNGLIDDTGLQRLMDEYTRRTASPAPPSSALFGGVSSKAQGNEEATVINLDADTVRAAAFNIPAQALAPAPAPPRPRAPEPPRPAPPRAHETEREFAKRVIDKRFEVIEQIGRGGMGVVYKARDLTDGKTVALKMLVNKEAVESAHKRFLRESKSVMKIDHPNIVRVYHTGEVDNIPYYAMEFVEGRSFGDMIEDGTIDLRVVARVGRDIAMALAEAHTAGIIHRDVKPDNILMTRDGTPKIADFGLAKDRAAQTQITMGGNALGTPVYMPPEQAMGRLDEIDGRSDVYSLGATLYEAATGEAPFRGDDPFKIMESVVNLPLLPPSRHRPGLGDLETIIVKAMEKSKRNRYASAADMAEDLERYLADEPVQAVKTGGAARAYASMADNKLAMWIMIGAVVALLIGAAFAFMGRASADPPAANEARARDLAKQAHESLVNAETGRLVGRREQMKADLEKALRLAELASGLDPTLGDATAVAGIARRRLAVLTGAPQAYLEAGAVLDRAVGALPHDPEVRMERALTYLFLFARMARRPWPILSDPKVAFPAAAPLVTRPEEELERYRNLAATDLEVLAKDQNEAVSQVAKAFLLSIAGAPADVVEAANAALAGQIYRPELLHVRGRARLDLGGEEPARSATVDYNGYLNLSPGEASIYGERGEALFRSSRYDEAAADFAKAEELGAPAADMAWNRAVCWIAAKDEAKALAELGKVLTRDTSDAHRWMSRALLHERAERWEDARKDLEVAGRLVPGNEEVALALGEVQAGLGDGQTALKTYSALIQNKPGSRRAFLARAQLRGELNQVAAGIEDFTKALELKADDSDALLGRADYYARRGDLEKSNADVAKLLQMDPKNPVPWVRRGRNGIRGRKYAEAAADFNQALSLAPEDVDALTGKGDALYQDGKIEPAFTAYGDAVRFHANDVGARMSRAQAALKQFDALKGEGDAAKKMRAIALADLQEAVKLDPEGEDGADAKKLIEKYGKGK